MLAPQCGLIHNVTFAVFLQVQCKVTLLHYFKYSVTMFARSSVTMSDFLYMMCSWQMKVTVITLLKLWP